MIEAGEVVGLHLLFDGGGGLAKASWCTDGSRVNERLDECFPNEKGSSDLYLGPQAPAGNESNWIQTVPGEGWFCLLRLYSAPMPWYDQTWRIGEIELVD